VALSANHNDPGTKAARLIALVGTCLLLSAGVMFYRENQLALRGLSATGTVVDFRSSKAYQNSAARQKDADPNGVQEYRAPVIRFATPIGEIIQFAAPFGSFPDGLNKGDSIPVLYPPEDPRGAEVKGTLRLNVATWALSLLGGAFLLPALFMSAVPALRGRAQPTAPGGHRNRPT
jgi:uncharacterized protein DUF3592